MKYEVTEEWCENKDGHTADKIKLIKIPLEEYEELKKLDISKPFDDFTLTVRLPDITQEDFKKDKECHYK